MKSKAVFYHAGCPVCLEAERAVNRYLDRNKVDLEVVDFSGGKDRLADAEKSGVKSVPALVVDGQVFHLNYGASLADLRK